MGKSKEVSGARLVHIMTMVTFIVNSKLKVKYFMLSPESSLFCLSHFLPFRCD